MNTPAATRTGTTPEFRVGDLHPEAESVLRSIDFGVGGLFTADAADQEERDDQEEREIAARKPVTVGSLAVLLIATIRELSDVRRSFRIALAVLAKRTRERDELKARYERLIVEYRAHRERTLA